MTSLRLLLHAAGNSAPRWQAAIDEHLPKAEVRQLSEIKDDWQADYALVWNPPAELFTSQQRLKGLFNLGAGVDALLANPDLPETLPVYKLRDAGMAERMTDYIRYGLLHFRRDMDRYRNQQAQGLWKPYGVSSHAKWPVGVMGLGAIGAEVAARLHTDGYSVLGWSRSPKSLPDIETCAGHDALAGFLARCRALVCVLPATQKTRHLLNKERLSQLSAGAILINCGRGEVLDHEALIEQVDSGHLRGALLDVFEQEPLPADSALYSNSKIIITPHVSAPTPIAEAAQQIAESIERLEAGKRLETVDRDRGY
ncbi:glyoxylate/hydroxypyruvate reductase A [Aestuariirhabdus sp. Z084]|uniref:2-hydroxyacid dehydrogenase n=1 Tax=Aestuariirhabdus haliotis TaxID=2918751 RepID=UPI00201B43F5|nr:glyoxylate/hydroxypyruvate reductase A [Aestuariirhabdus haliotis]MCL6417777.1 glyoxylate/hydroxypyruvate reductase A [Aestuariirhabdus haliotis]MCL6421710.1 glyoxylate/hydroxypyruvate reductase A [Aestuariirhabdus haliotis]